MRFLDQPWQLTHVQIFYSIYADLNIMYGEAKLSWK